MISVIATLHCKTDALATLKIELKKLVLASSHEEGCIAYELYGSDDEPELYIITEHWKDNEALNRHKESTHYKYFVHIAPALLAKPVEIKIVNRLV
jgi:quinol monooxygenase YgiN